MIFAARFGSKMGVPASFGGAHRFAGLLANLCRVEPVEMRSSYWEMAVCGT